MRSLLYRVEQVFLIHRSSGLLLQHVAASSAEAAETKDPEMVSGMLTAIQDFVRDSVSGAGSETLETVRLGEIEVLLAYGPDAILAGFVRGVAPRKLTRVFQDTLDAIEQKKAEALHAFSGDTSHFDSCRPQLQACLLGQGRPDERSRHSWGARALLYGLPALLVLALAGWWIYSAAIGHRFEDFAHRLEREPGIVLTRDGKAWIEVLHLRTSRSFGGQSRIALTRGPVIQQYRVPLGGISFAGSAFRRSATACRVEGPVGEARLSLHDR